MNDNHTQPLARYKELPLDNNAIDLNKLIKIPGGGTHHLYKVNDHSKFLLKVIKRSIGNDLSTLKSTLTDLTDKYQQLYSAFGEARCLLENRSIHQIKESTTLMLKNAIISLVDYDACFHSKEKFGFNTEAIEAQGLKIKHNEAKYHSMNMFFLGKDPPKKPLEYESFLLFHETFRPIFKILDKDISLQATMKEFLAKFKSYYKQTGQLLDFTGYDNVLFYKKENSWHYKVGSAIKIETREETNRLIQAIAQNPSIVQDATTKWTHIFFVPSWIRILNATAEKLGMSRIVDDITFSKEDSENFSKIYQFLPPNHPALNN